MKRLILGLALMAAATAACSSGGGGTPATGGSVTIVAKDLKFLTTSITAPADAAFAIELDNQESVPHNIAVSDATGASVFKGEIVTGTKVSNAIPALAAGSYPFICEVHPQMKGTITAE